MLRSQTCELLTRFGLAADATHDEQQLIDPEIIYALIEASGLKPIDTVMEIGPGVGNITTELLGRASKVYAVEKNPKFMPLLRERLSNATNIELIFGDALIICLNSFDILISNLPYAIAEAFLHRLERLNFRAASLILPSTLANTITAKRGESGYSKLTMETELFYTATILSEVMPESYYPEPKTATSIVVFRPRNEVKPFEEVMRGLFYQRGKKTGNALREAMISASSRGFPSTKKTANRVVDMLGLDGAILEERVARLTLGSMMLIYSKLEQHPL